MNLSDSFRGLPTPLALGCPVLVVAALAVGCEKNEATPEPAPKASAAKSNAEEPAAPKAPPLPEPPKNLLALSPPKDNPTTAEKVALGRQLFFDKELSSDSSLACYSCHQNEDGTGGHDPLAIGAEGKQLPRHAPALWNVAYLPKLYWDGRAGSLEAQAKGAWGGPMGVGADNLDAKAEALGELPRYQKQFDAVFPGVGATADTVAQAISAYERTLFCAETAFDKFAAGDTSAMTADQQAGKDLFIGKAACHSCHTPPMFSDAFMNSDGAYHNVGVGIEGKKPEEVDVGRQKISDNPSEWAAFKTPSLRNVSKSAPYFHDGSVAKLEDAVRFMVGGGYKNKGLDPKMLDKKLTDEEIKQLVAFLGALECEGELTPPEK